MLDRLIYESKKNKNIFTHQDQINKKNYSRNIDSQVLIVIIKDVFMFHSPL